jgi:radical SAM protein with 4Fe4S-binding SPASM domain
MGKHIPSHLVLQWHVTERCNLRCAHCYQGGELAKELPLEALLQVLQQYRELLSGWREQSGSRRPSGRITLTGGEPFVRRDFWELLEAVSRARGEFSFAILSNGTLLAPPLARRLKKLGPAFVQVSLEGTEATHDSIRGRGTFLRAVSALSLLVRQGVRTQISFTAHRGNYREFPEVARIGRRLGVSRVWADRLIPAGAGGAMEALSLSPPEVREFFQLMGVARQEAGSGLFRRTEISMRRALQFLVGGGRPYHCTAGDSLITVLPNGDLVPCRRMPIRVGNVLQQPLAQLYQGSPLFKQLREPERSSAGCGGCALSKVCRGGLRCLAFAQTGDPFRADPGCWLAESKEPAARAAQLTAEAPALAGGAV